MLFKEKELSGWGNYPKVKTKLLKPRYVEEVRQILKYKNNVARGLGRSYGDQSVNEDHFTTDLSALNHFISFDAEKGILECEAGVCLADIISTFAPKGWFPLITPGTKFVTIGGAIANDIHGKAHHVDGSFSSCVLEFKILLADGSLLTASRKENPDLFWANFGGLGLLGFIISAKIKLRKIETTYFITKSIKISNIEEMLDAFDQYDQQYQYSVAWIDPLAKGKSLGKGVLSLGNHATVAQLSPAKQKSPLKISSPAKLTLPFFLPDFSLNKYTVSVLNKAIEIVQSQNGSITHYESFFYPLDAIHYWNRGYGKRGFIQYQFVIPPVNGSYNITRILTKIASSGCVPFLNVLKKLGKAQTEMLSFPMEGYTFAIDFPVTKNLPSLIRDLDEMVLHMQGRIYLGKDAMLDEKTFRAMYPNFEKWLAVKQKYDPTNFFSSNIARRLGLKAKKDENKLVIH